MSSIIQKLWDKSLQPAFRSLGIDICRYPAKPEPHWTQKVFNNLLETRTVFPTSEADEFLLFCMQHASESYAQFFQDLFVRWQLANKREGYFVEFGATDGINLSNSKGLEEHLAWRGILAEPARCWHERLRQNRLGIIDTRCVWAVSGQHLQFNEVSRPELSTIQSFSDKDDHAAYRQEGSSYDVETISLNDLLVAHAAPKTIDFLSVDTEGSELSILSAFDFTSYQVSIITVEHNETTDRQKIFELLSEKGFSRKFVEFSRCDDWYVNNALIDGLVTVS
jgi:FkbM family methyltransferase